MNSVSLIKSILMHRLKKKKIPISVCFELTHRCTAHCSYCEVIANPRQEMGTQEVFHAIDAFHEAGMVRLGLTGGEALLRDDLPQIIAHASQKGIYTTLNSNGELVVKRRAWLKNLNALVLSFNGDKTEHESTKEGVSYDKVLEAIQWGIAEKLDVLTITTLTAKNIKSVPHILETAKKNKFWTTFQPVLCCGTRDKLADDIAFDPEEIAQAISQIIDAKHKGYPVANSYRYLRYFRDQMLRGEGRPKACRPSRFFCTVLPDGEVIPCNIMPRGVGFLNGREIGYQKAFEEMPDFSCSSFCPGPYTELSSLFSLAPDAWINGGWIQLRRNLAKIFPAKR